MTPLPPIALVRQFDTHRLVPSRHLPDGASVLGAIADDEEHLKAIFELDGATNERMLGEHRLLPGIGPEELVFGVPCADVINASFCHANPLGSRFNGPDRGAWYAGFEIATSQAEVSFHKSVQLAEVGRFDDSVTYDDYVADFSASFHDLRHSRGALRRCLDPHSYVDAQALAERMLGQGALGVVYPSVRHAEGTCVSCFRPALVMNVRKGKTYRFTWDGSPDPTIRIEKSR